MLTVDLRVNCVRSDKAETSWCCFWFEVLSLFSRKPLASNNSFCSRTIDCCIQFIRFSHLRAAATATVAEKELHSKSNSLSKKLITSDLESWAQKFIKLELQLHQTSNPFLQVLLQIPCKLLPLLINKMNIILSLQLPSQSRISQSWRGIARRMRRSRMERMWYGSNGNMEVSWRERESSLVRAGDDGWSENMVEDGYHFDCMGGIRGLLQNSESRTKTSFWILWTEKGREEGPSRDTLLRFLFPLRIKRPPPKPSLLLLSSQIPRILSTSVWEENGWSQVSFSLIFIGRRWRVEELLV